MHAIELLHLSWSDHNKPSRLCCTQTRGDGINLSLERENLIIGTSSAKDNVLTSDSRECRSETQLVLSGDANSTGGADENINDSLYNCRSPQL